MGAVAQRQEANDLGSLQCGFESHRPHWPGRRPRRLPAGGAAIIVVAVTLAAAAIAACAAAPPARQVPRFAVSPLQGLADGSFVLRATGLRPGAIVTVQASAVDATGLSWISSASYRADHTGAFSTSSAAAVQGSYGGVDPAGLLWSMRPANGTDPRLAFFVPSAGGWTVTLRIVTGHRQVAEASVRRLMQAPGVTSVPLPRRSTGFTGRYFAPPGNARRPAVLVFDGSDPGMQVPLDIASLLASHGIPALALCYFGCPGLPSDLDRIPLEYFMTAVRWLARRQGVNGRLVWLLGISRGSEAALLLGADYPALVHGVIALVPSNVVNEALRNFYQPVADSAWTLRGRPVPFTKQFGTPAPTDNPAAIIPVQRIAGPILLIAAQDDRLWPSPAYSNAIMARLARFRRPFPRQLLDLPGAGHDMSETVPNLPAGTSVPYRGGVYSLGGTRAANQAAKVRAWQAILSFINAHSS